MLERDPLNLFLDKIVYDYEKNEVTGLFGLFCSP